MTQTIGFDTNASVMRHRTHHRPPAISASPPATIARPSQVSRPPAAPAPMVGDSSTVTSFSIARTVYDVLAAWRLVHRAYTRRKLIEPNEHGIHAVPHARTPGTCVIIGRRGEQINCTLTVIADGDEGLPLESVYPAEINRARRTSLALVEIGLLAERGGDACSFSDMRDLMRLGFFAAFHAQADLLIGVHPRHAGFYQRYWAFDRIGPTRTYPRVRHRPVVLLRLNPRQALRDRRDARGVAYAAENIVTAGFFAQAFDFAELNSPPLDADALAGRQALALAC